MSLTEPFATERLWFRMLRRDDIDEVYRQFSDPDMCRYFSEPPVTRNEAMGIIDQFQNRDEDGYLRYGMFHRESGDFIGTCGYHHWDREKRQVELGYDIWKAHWQQGYASEALVPLIEICFTNLGVDLVYVLVHGDNVGSRATAAKAGFSLSEPCRPLDEPTQVCMKLSRTEWENGAARSRL